MHTLPIIPTEPSPCGQRSRAFQWFRVPSILGSSTKVAKGRKKGVLTAVVYLSPARESGWNVCPWSTEACRKACLGHSSGHLQLKGNQRVRIRKTLYFMLFRDLFLAQLREELRKHVARAKRAGLLPAVRFNGSSDLPIERIFPDLFVEFPTVQWYDYTKSRDRYLDFLQGRFPKNYHLTFSYSGAVDDSFAVDVLFRRGTVAVIFGADPPKTWKGFRVVSGDETDIRFRDPRSVVVALSAKGKARKDSSGFVVRS